MRAIRGRMATGIEPNSIAGALEPEIVCVYHDVFYTSFVGCLHP